MISRTFSRCPGRIAVHLAVLARRLFLKRATQATLESVGQKIGAFGTDRVLVQRQARQLPVHRRQGSLVGPA